MVRHGHRARGRVTSLMPPHPAYEALAATDQFRQTVSGVDDGIDRDAEQRAIGLNLERHTKGTRL